MVNKISRAPTKGAQLQDSQCWGQADALQVAAGAHNPWEAKLFLKHHGEKRLTSSPKCVSEDPERKIPFPQTLAIITGWDSLKKFPASPLVHIPNSEHQFLGDHPTRQSASGKGVPHITYMWASVIAYYFKLFLNPIMDLFLFLAGRVLNTFEFWAQSVLSPVKADPIMQMRLVRNGDQGQTSTQRGLVMGKSLHEGTCPSCCN